MKLFSLNLGCKVNAYELRSLTSILLKHGYEISDAKHFDVAIINTCTVTHVASQKSRQQIRKLRRANPKAIIIVIGCYVINNAKVIVNECGADIVIASGHYHEILDLIKKFKEQKRKIIQLDNKSFLRKKANYEELGTNTYPEVTRAYIKISDGCDSFCSYCIIPLIRGKLRSRDPKQILCEIKFLIERGYKEIVLAGIDTSNYGNDLKNYHFSDLLKDILKNNPKLYRLRLSSIEITRIDDKFLKLLKTYPNFANHLHISLQSGSDAVLRKMNRHYTSKQFLAKVNAIRKVRKDIALTTDIIVGFPNEGEKEFMETYNFIKKVKFAQIHVFPFSKREGTAANLMKDISSSIKKERTNRLLALSRKLKSEYEKQFINKKLEVLFESNFTGLTSNYLRVKGNFKSNQIKKITIKKSNLC